MLGCMFPPYCSVTAKSSLKWMPFLGQFSKSSSSYPLVYQRGPRSQHEQFTDRANPPFTVALSKTVFINRSSRSSAVAAMAGAAETMHSQQQSVFIFPEGTRSYANTPTLLPFKKGAFHLAVQAQVPIVPVVVANYSNVLDVKRKMFNAGKIPVSILEPVETKGLGKEDVEDLVRRVQDQMAQELVRITEHAEKQGVADPKRVPQGLGAVSSGAERSG